MLHHLIRNPHYDFSGDFSCGRITKARKKREASLPDFQEDFSDTYDVIDEENFVETPVNFSSLVPSVQSQNATLLSKSDDSDRNVRVVNGTDCKPGECPWQVNEFNLYVRILIDLYPKFVETIYLFDLMNET